jgi:hypothetical protein
MLSRPSSARRRHLGHARAVLGDQPLPDRAGRMPLLTRHVPSASSHSSMMAAYGPIAGLGCGRYVFRGGGTALASACRTVRRCT